MTVPTQQQAVNETQWDRVVKKYQPTMIGLISDLCILIEDAQFEENVALSMYVDMDGGIITLMMTEGEAIFEKEMEFDHAANSS